MNAPTPMPDAPDGAYPDAVLETPALMTVRWCDDRSRWSNEWQIDLGKAGDAFPTVRRHRLGMYRTRQFELVLPSPAIQCVVLMEADDEVCR